MKVSDLMANRTIDNAFTGEITADDMVLAVDFTGKAASIDEYVVAQRFVSEHSGALESQSAESSYIRSGNVTTKTGTTRTITVNGNRYVGDDFQDQALSHEMKYGRGAAVVKKYIYFAIQNGEGEEGTATVIVESDTGGTAGENASFSLTLTSTEEPKKYTYSSSGA